jgi:hypothetical protein
MSGRGPCDGGVSEVHGRSHHVVEPLWETVAQLLLRPPRGPPLLADIAVPKENLSQRPQIHAAMPCYLMNGVAQLSAVHGVAPGEQVDVGVVAPPGVHRSPSDSGHDLFGVDHGERVSSRGDLPAQQPWDADLLGWRDDRIASADINVEVSTGGREPRGHRHPDPWVDVLVPYLPRGGCLYVERRRLSKPTVLPGVRRVIVAAEAQGDGRSASPLPAGPARGFSVCAWAIDWIDAA